MIDTARAGGSAPIDPQLVLQAGTLDQAHVDVEHPVDVAEVVHRDDVRFLQSRGDAGFAPKTLLKALVRGHLGAKQLDRHQTLSDGVVGAVHLAHAADADQRLELIRSESGTHASARRSGNPYEFLPSFPIRVLAARSGGVHNRVPANALFLTSACSRRCGVL